jgi:hypothetical protein
MGRHESQGSCSSRSSVLRSQRIVWLRILRAPSPPQRGLRHAMPLNQLAKVSVNAFKLSS